MDFPWSEEAPQNEEHERYQKADNEAGYQREIETEVFLFYQNIAWKASEPGDFLACRKEDPQQNEKPTDHKDTFAILARKIIVFYAN